MKKTNKFLSLLAFALVMVGCSDDLAPDTMKVGNETIKLSDQEIKFDVAANNVATRAGYEDYELKTANIESDGFGVFASYTGKEHYVNTTVTPNFMYNQKVDKTSGEWSYAPVKYWPATETFAGGITDEQYISFFAYAPYTEVANFEKPERTNCIAGFSESHDEGDPWLIYVLSPDPWDLVTSAETGDSNDDGDGQVDLLYGQYDNGTDLVPMYDVTKPALADATKFTKFSFRHALGVVGNTVRIALKDDDAVTAFTGKKVLVKKVVINYKNLTRKAQLVLNSNGTPNWKPIISGEVTTNRSITIEGDQIPVEIRAAASKKEAFDAYSDAAITGITTVGDPANPTTYYDLETLRPLFYIPYQVAEQPQQAEVVLTYQVIGDGMEPYDGVATSVINLNTDANEVNNLNLLISDGLKYENLLYPVIGDPYYSDGSWGDNPHQEGATMVGMVAYLGDDIERADGTMAPHGLVVGLYNAEALYEKPQHSTLTDKLRWGPNDDETLPYEATLEEAYETTDGEARTQKMYDKFLTIGANSNGNYWAAYAVGLYDKGGVASKGKWHMGTLGEWVRIFEAVAAYDGVPASYLPGQPFATLNQIVDAGGNFLGTEATDISDDANTFYVTQDDNSADMQLKLNRMMQIAAVKGSPGDGPYVGFNNFSTECHYWVSNTADKTHAGNFVIRVRASAAPWQGGVQFYYTSTSALRLYGNKNDGIGYADGGACVRPLLTF